MWTSIAATIGICLFSLTQGAVAASRRPEIYVQFHGEDAFSRIDPGAWYRAGVDHLILRVFRNQSGPEGGLLFRNQSFRVIRPLLESFLERAKNTGPLTWSWMIARRFDWVNDPRWLDREFRDGRLHVIPRLDLFDPQVTDRVVSVYRNLAQSGTAGILIQDDLVIRSREGLSNWGRARYFLDTKRKEDVRDMLDAGSAAHRAWVNLKNRRVAEVLGRIVESCRKENPGILLGMDLYYETPLDADKGRNWYSHDLRLLMNTGIDRIFLMVYHRQMAEELGLGARQTADLFARTVRAALEQCGQRLVVKLQVRDWHKKERIPAAELDRFLALLPPELAGICLTPVKESDLEWVRDLLTRRGWSRRTKEEKSR